MEVQQDERLPWYRDKQTEAPFRLTTCFKNLRGQEYRFVSLFPWSLTSLPSLYYGHFDDAWPRLIETYAGSIVVGGTEGLYLVDALRPGGRQRKQIRLNTEGHPITAVAWALSWRDAKSLDPLLVIAMSGMVCVYSVGRGEPVGFLRGHGGPISSIAVHPHEPSYICTTSSDQTARICNLDRFPDGRQMNPPSLPGTGPSKGGAPHGIRSSEKEEWGKGQCISVLVGVEVEMDRMVKIWRVHDYKDEYKGQLLREDKPLFSSTLIHRSSVASVVWLAQDTLLTHCTSTAFSSHIELLKEQCPVRDHSKDDPLEHEWFGSAGRIVILRWLALERFFPPSQTRYPSIQRGCASDYQESSSFTVLASIPLPYYPHTPYLRVFGDVYHDHIILIAHQRTIRLLNTSHAPGVEIGEFPADVEQFPTAFIAPARLHTEEKTDKEWLRDNDWVRSLGWCINLDPRFAVDEQIKAVDVGLNGEMIVGVGSKGSMWIWMKDIDS
ncbi:hypothetical protein BC827DRAFT_1165606 [Russula dissimulans]|nr:hypothetical protein BC827DRAFT_1165606 [Russula dissimulans]